MMFQPYWFIAPPSTFAVLYIAIAVASAIIALLVIVASLAK